MQRTLSLEKPLEQRIQCEMSGNKGPLFPVALCCPQQLSLLSPHPTAAPTHNSVHSVWSLPQGYLCIGLSSPSPASGLQGPYLPLPDGILATVPQSSLISLPEDVSS